MVLDCNGKPVSVEPIPDRVPIDPYEERMLAFVRMYESWPYEFRRAYDSCAAEVAREREADLMGDCE